MLVYAYALAGRREDALKGLEDLKVILKERYVAPTCFANVYIGLSDQNQALDWLQQAYEGRDESMTYLRTEPILDPLRSNPRFQELLRKMNFPGQGKVPP
jgi:hypothetical protein